MVEEALLVLKNEGAIGWDGGLYESCRPGVSVCVCVGLMQPLSAAGETLPRLETPRSIGRSRLHSPSLEFVACACVPTV